jgi:threonine/homoserine/homoserine lactone efflux protein
MVDSLSLLFIATSLVLIVTPGQDMMLVMSRSIAQGWKAGVVTAAGVSTGLLGHSLLAALGLGAVLMASEMIFMILKYVGAAYLVYLGIKLLVQRSNQIAIREMTAVPMRTLFFQGAFSNLSNPKITIFYFAYLPQFIPAETVNPTLTLFTLGVAFAGLTFLVKGPVGYGAGVLSGWLRSRPTVLSWINRSSGAVLVALGIKLALARRS